GTHAAVGIASVVGLPLGVETSTWPRERSGLAASTARNSSGHCLAGMSSARMTIWRPATFSAHSCTPPPACTSACSRKADPIVRRVLPAPQTLPNGARKLPHFLLPKPRNPGFFRNFFRLLAEKVRRFWHHGHAQVLNIDFD